MQSAHFGGRRRDFVTILIAAEGTVHRRWLGIWRFASCRGRSGQMPLDFQTLRHFQMSFCRPAIHFHGGDFRMEAKCRLNISKCVLEMCVGKCNSKFNNFHCTHHWADFDIRRQNGPTSKQNLSRSQIGTHQVVDSSRIVMGPRPRGRTVMRARPKDQISPKIS